MISSSCEICDGSGKNTSVFNTVFGERGHMISSLCEIRDGSGKNTLVQTLFLAKELGKLVIFEQDSKNFETISRD